MLEPEPRKNRSWSEREHLGLASHSPRRFLPSTPPFSIFFKPNLLFSLTTTAGGDTGAHHYPAQYLIQELLPHFRLTGWAPGWYAGMPMLTFYFPFPFLLIAILNWFLPYTIAFKIVTVLGVFALPATAYAFGRLLRVRRPFPIMAAVFAMAMLLMESYSIYGGNILSTLAGEFGYMLSFALVFLFLGTLYRGMEKPGFNMLFVLNCLILMALVLSHIVTTIVLVTHRARAAARQPRAGGRCSTLAAVAAGRLLPDRLLVAAVRRQPGVDRPHGLEPAGLAQGPAARPRCCRSPRSRSSAWPTRSRARSGGYCPWPGSPSSRWCSSGRCPTAACGMPACCPSSTCRSICGRRTEPPGWCGRSP